MSKTLQVVAVLVFGIAAWTMTAWAADHVMHGTLVSENSVQCGSQEKGKTSTEVMCQEYVIRTDTTEYHVRQQKASHSDLLPVNAPVELTLNKDKMKFKVNGKSYEMLVVSESAAPAPAAAAKP